ncbi:MAG TPA: NAD(P)H-dependent oxidoreductase [Burkholderiales bacterium]|nr:NAD(P)H-dependent oxidoreductase [Burkholderiales bacterium]
MKRIVLIQGHPDPTGRHFVPALASAYERAARQAGHNVQRIDVARLRFPLLRSAAEWQWHEPPAAIRKVQAALAAAQHVVIVFPLWLGDMPALLKGFLEQLLRPGFAFAKAPPGKMPDKRLKGRSARIVVTMGMPAFFYRMYYRGHSVKSLKRNILEFCGISPVRTTYIGMVGGTSRVRSRALERVWALGRKAA